MPRDDLGNSLEEEDEDKKDPTRQGARRKFNEFDCPLCSANNPAEEFGNGDEVVCGWCGIQFDVKVTPDAQLKLRES